MLTTAVHKTKLDIELPVVEAMLAGDQGAFEEFVRRQGRWVRGIIYGVLGDEQRLEDVTQQVWTLVWQQIGTLQEPRHWRTWLYRLARNAAVDAGRQTTRRRKLNRAAFQEMRPPSVADGAQPAVQVELERALREAIQALPALYREPFVLRHLEGWSYRQIADVLQIPVDTVETRLVRARRHLREALQGKI